MREYRARGASLSGHICIALLTVSLFSCLYIFIGRNGFQNYRTTETFNSAYTIVFGDDNDDVSYNAKSSVADNFEHEKNKNENGIDNDDGNVETITTTDENAKDVKENNGINYDDSEVKTSTTADNDHGDVKKKIAIDVSGINNDDGDVDRLADNDDDAVKSCQVCHER